MNRPAGAPTDRHVGGETAASLRIFILDQGRGFGGTVVVAATLMRQLAQRGHTAVLASAADPQFVRERVAGAGTVYALRPPYSYVEAGRWRTVASRLPVPLLARAVNYVGSKAWSLANVPYLWRLFRAIRRERPHLIHANNFANLEGLALALATGIPCLMHAHGLIGRPGPIGKWLRRRLRCPIVAISEVVADSARRHHLPGETVTVLHNPVDDVPPELSGAHFRAQHGIPAEALLAGIVGRVVRWKGQREFVLACLLAMRDVPALHAVIVGDASDFSRAYLDEVRALIHASPFAERFHFTGFIPNANEAYAALDLLVHGSIEPEPFGLVITEAMMHAVPVIASNAGAPLEIITHGENGLLQDPADTAGLARAIVSLAEHRDRRVELGRRGREHARRAFDAPRYATRMLDCYHRLLSTAPGDTGDDGRPVASGAE